MRVGIIMTNKDAQDIGDVVLHLIDGLSVVTVLGTLMGILPDIAATFTIIWTGIRIYESDTFRKMIKKNEKDGGAS